MTEHRPAETFPPGEFIKDELEARGWSQVERAEILGRPPRLVSELVSGKRSVTPETAKGLAEAFGTSPALWMNLESQWQLSRMEPSDNSVARRSRLYGMFPVKEMIRRGWIPNPTNIDDLEEHFKRFFGIDELTPDLDVCAAFRRGANFDKGAQDAWLVRARQLAGTIRTRTYDPETLDACLRDLRQLLIDPVETRHVPRILAENGIRLLLIEPLPNSKIDGVCFWLDKTSPVVALSLRFDRIDWFWFTLFHELMHVKHRDGMNQAIVDGGLVDEEPASDLPESEKRADREAQDLLVPDNEIENFIARVRPLYSYDRVVGFANRLHVHPGIVVGQLQRRREIPYANLRKLLEKVKTNVLPNGIVDGWGYLPSIRI